MRASSSDAVLELRQQGRVLVLLAALERAGLAPVSARKLHGFAFLVDVLSPVWDLDPHERSVFKTREGPHYVDLQRALDRCVIFGLVQVEELGYAKLGGSGARITGSYSLRFESPQLIAILEALGAISEAEPIDHADRDLNEYLVELACALAVIPDDEFDKAAVHDATYLSAGIGYSNVITLGTAADRKARRRNGLSPDDVVVESVTIADRLNRFLPEGASFSATEKLHLYASYLGRKVNG